MSITSLIAGILTLGSQSCQATINSVFPGTVISSEISTTEERSTTISEESTDKRPEVGRIQGVKCRYSKCYKDAGFHRTTPRTFCSCSCRAKHTVEMGRLKGTFDTWTKESWDEMVASRSRSQKYIDSLKKNSHGRLTRYQDVLFRSESEACFAWLCDSVGWKWEYENRLRILTYRRPDGRVHHHLPDFYFPEYDVFIQVKYRQYKEDVEQVNFIAGQLGITYLLWNFSMMDYLTEDLGLRYSLSLQETVRVLVTASS